MIVIALSFLALTPRTLTGALLGAQDSSSQGKLQRFGPVLQQNQQRVRQLGSLPEHGVMQTRATKLFTTSTLLSGVTKSKNEH